MSDPTALLDGPTLIPELLRAAPQLRPILDRHGLRGCGGPNGPAESLAFFARAHGVPLAPLLAELRQGLTAAATPPAPNHPEDAIYRPFFRAAMIITLTAGAVWGAYLLLRIGWSGSFRAAGLHEVNAHGHAQIFGWVGLFVMGFAYQAFPRFKHTSLAWPTMAWSSLGLMLAGILGRCLGEPLADTWPVAGTFALVAAWLEVGAITLFLVVIVRTWQTSKATWEIHDGYILAALGWFLVQAVFEALYLRATLVASPGQELISLVATWQGALRDIQIHGFALLMILGVSQRILPRIYGFPSPASRLSLASLVGLNLALVGEVVGLVMMRGVGGPWAGLWFTSVLLLTLCVVMLVVQWGVFGPVKEADRSLKFIRAAYAWLLLSLAMLVLLPVYQFVLLPWLAPASPAVQMGFSHAYYGAIRHAITVGFISLMILGVAARIVPTLNGVLPHQLGGLWGPFVLINAGCALRVFGQTSTDLFPPAFPMMALSGLLEVTALSWWGAHLWAIMASGGPTDAEPESSGQGDPIEARHTVSAVLARYPETLPTFLALGFRPLANPVLRATLAHGVRVEMACRMLGLKSDEVIAALNAARRDVPRRTMSLPVVSGSSSEG
ncbi:MAG: DUF1858 domain-containing protein [Gemmataceae bacterium]